MNDRHQKFVLESLKEDLNKMFKLSDELIEVISKTPFIDEEFIKYLKAFSDEVKETIKCIDGLTEEERKDYIDKLRTGYYERKRKTNFTD